MFSYKKHKSLLTGLVEFKYDFMSTILLRMCLWSGLNSLKTYIYFWPSYFIFLIRFSKGRVHVFYPIQ